LKSLLVLIIIIAIDNVITDFDTSKESLIAPSQTRQRKVVQLL
jgi:hypothetical protein